MTQRPAKGYLVKRLAVVGVIGLSVLFGVYIGYGIWANNSFPTAQRPFGDYAAVTMARFNGTEYAFSVSWMSHDGTPLYAQLTSAASDAANTIVCQFNYTSPPTGETLFMPFTTQGVESSLNNVDLSIAVQSQSTGAQFTIVYSVTHVDAVPGNFAQNYACNEPATAA